MPGLGSITAIVVAASITLTRSINVLLQLGADPQTPWLTLDFRLNLMAMRRIAYALVICHQANRNQ